MKRTEVPIKILNIKENNLDIKLPFLEIPITTNYDFFKKRVAAGYFKIEEKDIAKKVSRELLEFS